MTDKMEEFEQLLIEFEEAAIDYCLIGTMQPSKWPEIRGRCNRAKNELLGWVKKVLDKG